MEKNKGAYFITVTSEREGRKAFSLRVTRAALVAIAAGFCLVLAALGVLFYTSAETARLHRLYGEARSENDKLTKENVLLRQIGGRVGRIDSLASYLEQLASPPTAAARKRGTAVPEGAMPDAGAAPDSAEKAFDVLPVEGWITQKFAGDTGGGLEHPGIDIAAPAGTNITAPASGTVTSVSDDRYYGRLIVIAHAAGYETRYGHCRTVFVSAQESVRKGQIIALVGSTGNSTAPHLHYEILKNGKNLNPLDVQQVAAK